jgi:hypothetical protein
MLLWQFNGCQYSKARSDRAVLSPTSVQASIQEILAAYILSSPRRKPGSISPGHVPSRVSKALPLPENSGNTGFRRDFDHTGVDADFFTRSVAG